MVAATVLPDFQRDSPISPRGISRHLKESYRTLKNSEGTRQDQSREQAWNFCPRSRTVPAGNQRAASYRSSDGSCGPGRWDTLHSRLLDQRPRDTVTQTSRRSIRPALSYTENVARPNSSTKSEMWERSAQSTCTKCAKPGRMISGAWSKEVSASLGAFSRRPCKIEDHDHSRVVDMQIQDILPPLDQSSRAPQTASISLVCAG